jgi:hypothetical protein
LLNWATWALAFQEKDGKTFAGKDAEIKTAIK